MDEEIGGSLPNARLGCFVQYKDKFLDAIMIQEGAQAIKPDSISVPLEDGAPGSDPRLVLIVKDIQNDEPYAGSVSIPRSILLEGTLGQTYDQWITLFDDQADDEYDGALGVQDDEEPRVRFQFTVTEAAPATPAAKAERKTAAARKQPPAAAGQPDKSYMQPIHNLKSERDRGASGEKAKPVTEQKRPALSKPLTSAAEKVPVAPTKSAAAAQGAKDSSAARRQLTNFTAEGPGHMTKIAEIQQVLDENNDKRQNVKFLKDLLDRQLNALVSNLKFMQNNNSEIELETIKRLQLVEQFGVDASKGLAQANVQNVQIKQDIADQATRHEAALGAQEGEKANLRKELQDLEAQLAQLKVKMHEAQNSHSDAVVSQQDMLVEELNDLGRPAPGLTSRFSPRKLEQNENARDGYQKLIEAQHEQTMQLRDLKRQVPALAIDFENELDLAVGANDLRAQRNAELQGEVATLAEEKRTLDLLRELESQKRSKLSFEKEQLLERVDQLKEEYAQVVESGDQHFNEYIENINNQVQEEQQLSQEINLMAYKSNLILKAKLDANKVDFERLRNLATTLGTNLEQTIAAQDAARDQIVTTKKEAHQGLEAIRECMRCNIGEDQKPLVENLTQLEHTCQLLDEKDAELYKQLMPQKDEVQKRYLANQVSNGLRMIMYSDKVDIEQHIEFNKSGMEKLQQMTHSHQQLIDDQRHSKAEQEKAIRQMDDQIALLKNEKQDVLNQIEDHKRELVRLRALQKQREGEIADLEGRISELDQQLDKLYEEMERIEEEIAAKDELLKELQRKLNSILPKKR